LAQNGIGMELLTSEPLLPGITQRALQYVAQRERRPVEQLLVVDAHKDL
jgi:hypothetical protein